MSVIRKRYFRRRKWPWKRRLQGVAGQAQHATLLTAHALYGTVPIFTVVVLILQLTVLTKEQMTGGIQVIVNKNLLGMALNYVLGHSLAT